MSQTRPDLTGEVRFKVPLPIVLPIAIILLIGGAAYGFSRVLLAVNETGEHGKDAAVAIALVTAANVLGACAWAATTKRKLTAGVFAELALVVAYPIIIGVAIASFGLGEASGEAAAAEGHGAAPAAAGNTVTAQGVAFNTDQLEFKAGEETSLTFNNEDTVQHNIAIYPDEAAAEELSDALFKGEIIDGGSSTDYQVDPLDKGEYIFHCDVHPSMKGTVTVQ